MKPFKRTNVRTKTKPKPARKAAARPKPLPKREPEPKPKKNKQEDTTMGHANYAEAKEELNRAAVHAQDALKKAFERTDKTKDEDNVSAMESLQKKFEALVDDANDIAPVEEPKKKKGDKDAAE